MVASSLPDPGLAGPDQRRRLHDDGRDWRTKRRFKDGATAAATYCKVVANSDQVTQPSPSAVPVIRGRSSMSRGFVNAVPYDTNRTETGADSRALAVPDSERSLAI